MSDQPRQRFAMLGAFLPMLSIFGVQAAKRYGWVPSKLAADVLTIAFGILCILGGIIAYRSTQAQVRRDLDEVENAGRIRR